jgi:uncharacterized protein (TIGR00730 family)
VQRICVFCGSSAGVRPAYARGARSMGELLARRGIEIVYGGGASGLMGELADAALDAGGTVIGVIPHALVSLEAAHDRLSDLRVVRTMHERKALMAELSDAFVALPGGLGTLEELFEVLTWAQLGLHPKACGLLDIEGYFGPLLTCLDHAVVEGFVRPENRALVVDDVDPSRLLSRLARAHRADAARSGLGVERA